MIGRRSGNFRRTVPGSGRRSYHRFVAATVSSFKKGTPRVLGWKDIFSRHIFLFVRGASQQATNNMGSFYVFPYMATGCLSSLDFDIEEMDPVFANRRYLFDSERCGN